MTTLSQAKEAIYARWVSQWGSTTPYTFDNEAYNPPPSTSWARLTVRQTASNQDTLGKAINRRFLRRAIVFIQIFTPAGKGTQASDTFATTARNIFEGVSFTGLWFRAGRILEATPIPDGEWYPVTVEAPFEYEELK